MGVEERREKGLVDIVFLGNGFLFWRGLKKV